MIRAKKYFKIANSIKTEKLLGMVKDHRKRSKIKKAKILAMYRGK